MELSHASSIFALRMQTAKYKYMKFSFNWTKLGSVLCLAGLLQGYTATCLAAEDIVSGDFSRPAREVGVKPFCFVQLTDTHLSQSDPEKEEDLLRSITQINAMDSVDFVLVTGDLTDMGDKLSLEKAESCLNLLKVPYYVLPGNHESKWSASACTAFTEVFGYEHFSFKHNGILFLGFNTGFPMRMAEGHASNGDVRWLSEQLKQAGRDEPVVIVTHYPLKEGDVDNWRDVINAVCPYNVRLCIGGHYHQSLRLDYSGIPGVLIRSNQHDKDRKQGYGIYQVGSDSIRVYVQRVGEAKQRLGAYALYGKNRNCTALVADYSVNKAYPQVKEQWVVSTGNEFYASPVVTGGTLFVGDESGTMTAYAVRNGRKLWSFPTGKRIVATAAVSEGILVFGSADKVIYALNARTGTLCWKVTTQGPVTGVPAIHGGNVYIGGSDHEFRALDLHTGKPLWSFASVKGFVETKPLLAEDKVLFGAWDNTLYALDARTGRLCWTWNTGRTHMFYSPAAVWPVASHDKVFIADPRRILTAINLKDGKTIWNTSDSQVRESVGISSDKSRIYAKTMNDSVVCYDAQTATPRKIWASDVGFGYEFAPSMLVEKEGVLFGSTKNGLIFGLDAQSGRLLWKHRVGTGVVNTVLPVSRKEILFTVADGKVGLLSVQSK